MDENYQKNGIVDANGQLTEQGKMYSLYLAMCIARVNRKDPPTFECHVFVQPSYIPKDTIDYDRYYKQSEYPLTEIGMKWFNDYIETHEFNEYIYDLVTGKESYFPYYIGRPYTLPFGIC